MGRKVVFLRVFAKSCPSEGFGPRDHDFRNPRPILYRMHWFSPRKDDVGPRSGQFKGRGWSEFVRFWQNIRKRRIWASGSRFSESSPNSVQDALVFAPQGRRGAEIGPGPDSTVQEATCGIGVPAPPFLPWTPRALGSYTSGCWRGLGRPQGRPNSTLRAAGGGANGRKDGQVPHLGLLAEAEARRGAAGFHTPGT